MKKNNKQKIIIIRMQHAWIVPVPVDRDTYTVHSTHRDRETKWGRGKQKINNLPRK